MGLEDFKRLEEECYSSFLPNASIHPGICQSFVTVALSACKAPVYDSIIK